jgi:hypothetical protein
MAIFVVAAICLTPGQAHANWSYEFKEDFRGNDVESESYFHSIIWPQGAFPPRQAYLYFYDTAGQRELGFGDYYDAKAYLSYRFPTGSETSIDSVSGDLLVDMRLQESSGYLKCSIYPDGVNLSLEQQLEPGSNKIHIESVRGSFHVVFSGAGVLIDNLEVNLYTPPAKISVPGDYATIQQAIDNAISGDIVEVAPGRYTGDIDFGGKTITVRSSDGPDETIIDCTGSEGHRGFHFHSGEGSDSVLRGFTITGATVPGSGVIGGGILCESSSPSIINCVIKNCSTEQGGGIGVFNGSPTIIDCVIEDCQAGGGGAGIALIGGSNATILHSQIRNNSCYGNGFGAGVYCWQSSAFFSNCDISHNTSQGSVQGGGAFCGGSSSIEFVNCVISNNTAGIGGGLCVGTSGDSVTITNCTIAHNIGGGIHSESSNITIINSIVWYNDGVPVMLVNPVLNNPVLYSCIEGGYAGQGNIESEPMFTSSSGSDYHLMSRVFDNSGEYSPCIDAGDPLDPVGAEPHTNGKRINMGAYGGTAEASKSEYGFIFHVDKSGSNSNSGMSRSDALATIQEAVDRAWHGDTILVWPGTYREDVDLKGKAITLQSADEAAVVTASTAFAFSFRNAEGPNCVLRNFIITGCNTTDGGAIFLSGGTPKLTNLTIIDNRHGISANDGSNPYIVNCILWNNRDGDLHQCTRVSYSCVQQGGVFIGINGNISEDPSFADPGSGDYHLKSRYGRYSPIDGTWLTDSLSSPCIDAGDDEMDPGREQEPHGGRINMGAYGGTPFASWSAP